ncbi:MAG: Helix-turn-helix domain [Myxococcaceae bacterium]|nr:Helix-turn-helix domain [Myxococcaceae bacterium]
MTEPLVVLTQEQLAQLIESAVTQALQRFQAAAAPAAPKQHAHLTVNEAADRIRCSPRWVRQLLSDGRLPTVKVGTTRTSHVRIPSAAVERLIADSTH